MAGPGSFVFGSRGFLWKKEELLQHCREYRFEEMAMEVPGDVSFLLTTDYYVCLLLLGSSFLLGGSFRLPFFVYWAFWGQLHSLGGSSLSC